ncbi:DgyrCDS14464 [Dimorphilus gyrociliatus]|uniref:DgyrCDS14464 n=1 Tax=Dimorphilus gyrociliatus TaxID=2664684 RepID=A0A7I8WDZ8_9ANNE|nr:DgyrCDS14464 [Dimorphilus gyrociliatus]
MIDGATIELVRLVRRGLDYSKKDVTVNVEVIYADHLDFPSVTICNQNKFRMTSSMELNLYKFLSNVYSSNGNNNVSFDQNLPKDLINNIEYIYDFSRHKQSNLIFNCYWAGEKCPGEYITKSITDYGICYTFNSPSSLKQTKSLTVTESGLNNALSLLLNLEQYEYMPGPDNDAGVKIFLHDDYKRPLMSDLGFAVAAGMHTLVGIKRTESESLGDPFGKCIKSNYKSHAECIDHCRLRASANICKCTPYEASAILTEPNQSYKRLCSIIENYGCIRTSLDKIKKDKNNCSCSVPCKQIIYEPNLSFSAISQFEADKVILGNVNRMETLKEEYLNVLEIGEKKIEKKYNLNYKFIEPFVKDMKLFLSYFKSTHKIYKSNEFFNGIGISLIESLSTDISNLTENFLRIENAVHSARMIELYEIFMQMFDTTKYFKERLFGPILIQKTFLNFDLEDCISTIETIDLSESSATCNNFMKHFRFSVFNSLSSNFKEFWIIALREAEIFLGNSDTVHHFQSEYIMEIERIFGMDKTNAKLPYETNCKQFFTNLLFEQEFLQFHGTDNNITNFEIGNRIRNVISGLFNIEEIFNDQKFQSVCLLKEKYNFFTPIHSEIWKIQNSSSDFLINSIDFKEELNSIDIIHRDVSSKVYLLELYLDKNSSITKVNITEMFELENFFIDIKTLISFYESINRQFTIFDKHVKQITKELGLLEDAVEKNLKWPYPIKDDTNLTVVYETVNEFYKIYNKSKVEYNIQHNCSEKALEKALQNSWSECFLHLADAIGHFGLKLPKVVTKSFTEIQYKYNDLHIFMAEFNEISKINKDFFLKNFAKVDVFYKEMNYQKITQQEKFGFLSLLSEVGGFMGLVLGASVITIIEFIEFFVYKIILNISENINRNKKIGNIHCENV